MAQDRKVVTEMMRDTKTFFTPTQTVERKSQTVRIPIGLNPPEHKIFRRVLVRVFLPEVRKARVSQFRAQVTRWIDKVTQRAGFEFMSSVAEPRPRVPSCV